MSGGTTRNGEIEHLANLNHAGILDLGIGSNEIVERDAICICYLPHCVPGSDGVRGHDGLEIVICTPLREIDSVRIWGLGLMEGSRI